MRTLRTVLRTGGWALCSAMPLVLSAGAASAGRPQPQVQGKADEPAVQPVAPAPGGATAAARRVMSYGVEFDGEYHEPATGSSPPARVLNCHPMPKMALPRCSHRDPDSQPKP